MPSIQFHGVANAVMACGATPVFADVDPRSLNIAAREIERVRTSRTRAVFLLHYGGHPAPMDEILAASDGLLVFEDAANAVASSWRGQACGTLGDGGVWSFDAMKILVAGDGGALWLRSAEARRSAEVVRYLGMPPDRMTGADVASTGTARWWEIEVEQPFWSLRVQRRDRSHRPGPARQGGAHSLPGDVRSGIATLNPWQAWATWSSPQAPPLGARRATTCTGSRPGSAMRWPCISTAMASTRPSATTHSTACRCIGSDARLPHADSAAERTLCIPIHQNLSDDDIDCRHPPDSQVLRHRMSHH